MPVISTNLRNTRESARLLRTEVANGVTQTNVQKALEQIASSPAAVNPTSVTAAGSPYVPLSTDTVLYVDTTAGPVVINLRPAVQRLSVPLAIKDIGGAAFTNNITINPSGAETIDSLLAFPINSDFGGVVLNPRSGVGYTVAP